MLSDSFEKPSFLRRLAKGVAQAFSAFPHFMSTISTMLGIFLSFFPLSGVLTTEHLSEPSIGILCVFLLLVFVFCGMPLPGTLRFVFLLLPLLPASTDDFLCCSLFWVVLVLPQGTETGSVWVLLLVEDTCFFGAEEMWSNSLVIKELIVAVVLRLMDPPPPFIPYRLWAMLLLVTPPIQDPNVPVFEMDVPSRIIQWSVTVTNYSDLRCKVINSLQIIWFGLSSISSRIKTSLDKFLYKY